MDMIRRIAAFLAALTDGILGGLFKALFHAATGRDLDAERAERDEAERRELAAQREQEQLEARHEETLTAAAQNLAEARALRREMAERRARHEAYGRAHEAAAEVRSSRWEPEPEPEGGAPMASAPAH